MGSFQFIDDRSKGIEVVSLEHVGITYPLHTHTGHYVLGIIKEGEVAIQISGQSFVCSEGECFSVLPDVRHSIKPVTKYYSMITTCIPRNTGISKELDIIKKEIMENPEIKISIEQMSQKVNISSYHLIRKFSDENGLTPHKFQMQCRIRKSQQLLKQGYKVTDVAQMIGFCDQSHLDRVFKKQVGITPEQFVNSAILSNAND